MHRWIRVLAGVGFCLGSLSAQSAPPLDQALDDLLAVGPKGQGNADAARSWAVISQAEEDALPRLFDALDEANPLSANYLRSGIEAVMERTARRDDAVPLSVLGEILLDRSRSSRSRNLAFEQISRYAPDLRDELLPGLLEDPSEFIRQQAVERLLETARSIRETGREKTSDVLLLQALQHARDVDQVREIAKLLENRGTPVDLPRHFGFVMHWKVIGPFDNTGREGFSRVEPPETEIDLDATYPGKHGPVRWQSFATSDPYGKVDFNEALGMEKEVCAYALAEFESEQRREVELRLGTKNAWKVWLNGELLFQRDEYHRGQRIDQYRLDGTLREGRNFILVKCCQNEQEQSWTVEWEFRLRVCDESGNAILAANRPPTPQPREKRRRPRGDGK